jgi:orotidine-5'-phosphate decarboxylase
MTYKEIARGLEDEKRRALALDLAEKLELLNLCMECAEIDRAYQANMRLFLAAQKQFANLLPPQVTATTLDALTAFNAGV